MMYKLVVLALVSAAVVSAYDVVQDEEGQEFYLVPLHRQRRQTNIGISKENPGVRITAGHKGTVFDNGNHRVDGGAFASKQFRPSGPATVGGQLGYSHVPSGSNLNVGAQHTQRFGTDLSASGRGNLWRQGNSRLDAVGSYNRHYGGLGGTRRPNYYGGLQFNHRF
ncbi:uncharacterized protein BDFB_011474 [Asbolus verrucosus]|uniref:Attacin C-terminal domain-containing protein n=1 Tax=Asbolus verrucosus TaxID=1661398 RepID=A0A482VGW5_ASBVE|nr:uncharacterized protein BDFB_011474 [Asbolus verrucosus]